MKRYGVVLQADPFLPRSRSVGNAHLNERRPASYRPDIEIDETPTRVLVEHVGAVDVTRLGNLAGHLAPEEQWGVDRALQTVLGLR